MTRPYKLPRRKTYEVLTGSVKVFGTTTKLMFTEVKANNCKDALNQFDKVATYCGETLVFRVKDNPN